MSDYFVGEIRMFGGQFAPENWQICNGSLLSISEYETLFTLLGTTFGGDGMSTFGLPDLRGRLPMGQGTGMGLTERVLGQVLGSEAVSLTVGNMPVHNHTVFGTTTAARSNSPDGQVLAQTSFGFYADGLPPSGVMKPFNPASIASAGGSLPHDNMMPSVAVQFIIATQGLYPSQN